jgi:hypothetical protein
LQVVLTCAPDVDVRQVLARSLGRRSQVSSLLGRLLKTMLKTPLRNPKKG